MARVAFIGVGTMGRPMAERVHRAGHRLVVHDRARAAASELETAGVAWADSVADAVATAEVICLSLPGPREVEDIVLGAGGVIASAPAGAIVVDHTTNGLETVRRVGRHCRDAGLGFLDAPVSGGNAGAQAGTLVVMVGGAPHEVDGVRPVLSSFGDPVIHFGPLGAGTVAKLVNNQIFLCGEIIFQEGLVLAAKAGIDPALLMQLLERTGAGGAHVRNGARVVGREFRGAGFALALAEKDIALALAAGRELDVPMPASGAAHQTFVEALAAGLGELRSFATLTMVERAASFEVPCVEPTSGDA